ncbi:hypothetical protein EAE96_007579 [Botrytis aclada]|nr:hypothetical protein EAE96_007579 [Botrytis aclada]
MAPSNNQSQSVESATTVLYRFSLADPSKSNDKYKQRISTSSCPTKSNGAANNKHRTLTSNLADSPTINEEREEVFEGLGTMEKAPMTLFRQRRNYRSQFQDESEAGFEHGDSMSKGQDSKHINPRTAQFMLRREQGLKRLLTLSDDQTSYTRILARIVARDTAEANCLEKTNTGSK